MQAQLTAGPPKAIAHRNTRFVAQSVPQSGASTPGSSTPGGTDTDSIAGSNLASHGGEGVVFKHCILAWSAVSFMLCPPDIV